MKGCSRTCPINRSHRYSRYCARSDSTSYRAFVDHLLYSVEQMLVTAKGWESTFLSDLEPHADYLCATVGPTGGGAKTEIVLEQFKLTACPATPVC
jgi:hypothetical protein